MITYYNFLLPHEVNGANQAHIRARLLVCKTPVDNGHGARQLLRRLDRYMAELRLTREQRSDMRSQFYAAIRQGRGAGAGWVNATAMVEQGSWDRYCMRSFVGVFGEGICTNRAGHAGKCYGVDATGVRRHFGQL